MTSEIYTLLWAEDGSYKKAHKDREAALRHVRFQMGETPERDCCGEFIDQWGRSMILIDTATACPETLALLESAMEDESDAG